MKLQSAKFRLKTILKDNMNRRSVVSKKWNLRWQRLHAFKTSDRLFSKRLESSWKRYNLEIVFDASGSMAFQNWEWIHSAFYRWIMMVQNLVKLFDWVIDINLTFFNLKEWTLTTKQILKFDLSSVDDIDKCFDYMWKRDMVIDENWHFIHKSWWKMNSSWGNREIINIQNAANRLYKKNWEKIIIILWDWNMHVDYHAESDMKKANNYICWQSVRKYNSKTANEVCKHIEKNWVHLLWIWLDMHLRYIPNNIRISSADEIYEKAFNFLKESLKK